MPPDPPRRASFMHCLSLFHMYPPKKSPPSSKKSCMKPCGVLQSNTELEQQEKSGVLS